MNRRCRRSQPQPKQCTALRSTLLGPLVARVCVRSGASRPSRVVARRLVAALCAAALAACATRPAVVEMLDPALQETPLPEASFAALGLDAARWQAAVDEVERRGLAIDQMALLVDGQVVAQLHRSGHGPRSRHDLRSATKSVTSLLVGAAATQGMVIDIDQPVAPLFPEWAAGAATASVTWRQLLSMRTGLDCDDGAPLSRGNEERMYATDDWLRFFFSLPPRGDAGQTWSYCTAGIVVAGEALARRVGDPLPAFARKVLFEPLGIAGERWQAAPRGVTDAGGHLQLTLSAMLKLGELMRQRGVWQGRRIVSESWVAQSLEPISRVDPSGRASAAWYGLAWWLEPVREGRVLSFQARGNGGQAIIVLPEHRAVIAFTGHAYNADLAVQLAPFDLVSRHLAPMLRERRQSQP
jgi:CubicO group peptidase (beta-lactamase class C family)